MAWNGSDQTGRAASTTPPDSRTRRAPASSARRAPASSARRAPASGAPNQTILHGLLAILLLLALAGAALWYFTRPSVDAVSHRVRKESKPSAIAEVKPAIVTNRVAKAPPPAPKKIDPNARPTVVGEVVNGYVLLPSGRLHKRVGVITNSVAARSKPWYRVFKHRCNNEIATYLSVRPGDTLVGTRQYTGTFKDDFIESLKTPVIVYSDDTPEVAQLKRDVNAARLQLKDALDRGEDIEQIMIDTRTQLQDLKRVKSSIEQVFNEAVKNCKTEQDVDDLLAASNRMLEEKGIAPLEANGITKMNILEELREEREALAEQGEIQTEGKTEE